MARDTIVPFTTIQDLNKQSKNRSVLLFGAGPIAEKTARKFKNLQVSSIVDNAENLWGNVELGVQIIPPKTITDLDNVYIVICTTSFYEISAQLQGYGLKDQVDYCVSPILNDLRIIDDLENISTSMLFTSGSPKRSNAKYGGGIYKLSVTGDEWEHKKVFSGNCYGLIKFGENYISVDTELGIFEFDKNFNILRSKILPKGMRAHGV
mgnify:CR=1 FL=1